MNPTQDMINGGNFYRAIDAGIAEMQKNTIEHPQDARYWLYLAQIYNFAQPYDLQPGYNSSYSQRAEQAIATGLLLSPKRQQFYFEFSQAKINEGQYQKAIDSSRTALSLDEGVSASHYNLALVYLESRQNSPASTRDLALQELEAATKITLSNPDLAFLLNIANTYANLNQYNPAVENEYEKALKIVNQIIAHPAFRNKTQGFKDQTYTQKILDLNGLNDLAGVKDALNELEKIDAATAQQLRTKLFNPPA
ncbi:MAG: hypothetical protein NTY61_00050 [Candidatus Parcubacteria bacterium]|nr:hypothetical protein [Candidatus Parcubacteria bacterium]